MNKEKSYYVLQVLFFMFCIFAFTGEINAVEWSANGYFSWFFSTDTRATSRSTFDQFGLAFIPKATITDKIDVYTQIIFEHSPYFEVDVDAKGARSFNKRSSGELTVNDAYLTYTVSDLFKFRAGRYAAPFGFWNTSMYADPIYPSARQPGRESFYARTSDLTKDSYFFQRYNMGAWILGSWEIISYDLYISNGRTRLSQHVDDDNNKSLGARLKVDIPVPGINELSVMYSRYQDTTSTADGSSFFDSNRTDAASFKLLVEEINFHSEYANGTLNNVSMEAFHTMIQYTLFENFTPFVRYEVFEPNKDKTLDKTFIAGGGLQINLLSGEVYTATLKLQYDKILFEEGATSAKYDRYFVGAGAGF